MRKVIPVIFHNLKNYDAHHIMQGIGKIKDHECEVIATNMEKYIAFSLSNRKDKCKISMLFIDSYLFIPASLEKLVEHLTADKLNILWESFSNNFYTEFIIIMKKEYIYMNISHILQSSMKSSFLHHLHFTIP